MSRGGARPGAGRPKGQPKFGGREPKRTIYASSIREAEGRIRDRLPDLVDVALSLALDDRSERMLIYCIDRVLGKPSQPIDFVEGVRRLASERGLDPNRVIDLYEAIKKRGAPS